MDIKIVEVKDEKMKSTYTEKILRQLPEWFGNEKALLDYIDGVRNTQLWTALKEDGDCLGIFSAKIYYGNTGDIYVCGVLPDYHKKGIGKKLFSKVEEYFVKNKCKHIIVKTLSEVAEYEPYERTRMFYQKVGFQPLITLTEMWDDENPCLIMIKEL